MIGFVVGKIAATWWAPVFQKYVLLVPPIRWRFFAAVMAICVLASLVSPSGMALQGRSGRSHRRLR